MFICPTSNHPTPLDHTHLLSAHTTTDGRLAYYRCACDGIVIVAPRSGQVVGHAAGPDQPAAATREEAALQACA